jgi:hypothetical protein
VLSFYFSIFFSCSGHLTPGTRLVTRFGTGAYYGTISRI